MGNIVLDGILKVYAIHCGADVASKPLRSLRFSDFLPRIKRSKIRRHLRGSVV
jgi:hypothetical protein